MKNFTGKVTDVDNNGNPIKKKSSGKNGSSEEIIRQKAVEGYYGCDDEEAGAQNCGVLLFL